MKECDIPKNRTECMNRVSKYVNTIAPILQERLVIGFSLKVDGTMYQKDKDVIQAIIDVYADLLGYDGNRRTASGYVVCDEYGVRLEAKDSYPVKYHSDGSGGYTCEYYQDTVYLWNNQSNEAYAFDKRDMVEDGEMRKAEIRLAKIETEISDLTSDCSVLRRLLGK
jgi:hypothetical protein